MKKVAKALAGAVTGACTIQLYCLKYAWPVYTGNSGLVLYRDSPYKTYEWNVVRQ